MLGLPEAKGTPLRNRPASVERLARARAFARTVQMRGRLRSKNPYWIETVLPKPLPTEFFWMFYRLVGEKAAATKYAAGCSIRHLPGSVKPLSIKDYHGSSGPSE